MFFSISLLSSVLVFCFNNSHSYGNPHSFLIPRRALIHQHGATPGPVPESWDMEGSVDRRHERVDGQEKVGVCGTP